MGNLAGAQKIAAIRLGVSHQFYMSQLSQGLKWCGFGRHWIEIDMFPPDVTRGSGKAQACKSCMVEFHDKLPKAKRKRYNRTPQQERCSHLVSRAVLSGTLPNPNTLPCVECGDIGSAKRHEYHHPNGYEAGHELDVLVLCTHCHKRETRRQMGLSTFSPPTFRK